MFVRVQENTLCTAPLQKALHAILYPKMRSQPYPLPKTHHTSTHQNSMEAISKNNPLCFAQNAIITQVATYKILASRLKLWAKMKPQTLSTKPWRVVA
jgi:hypothetical protein